MIIIIVVDIALQELLTNPNPKSPANGDANSLLIKNPAEYAKRIRQQALQNAPVDADEAL